MSKRRKQRLKNMKDQSLKKLMIQYLIIVIIFLTIGVIAYD